MQNQTLSAQEALAKLKEGNQHYLAAETNPGDVSPKIRQYTCDNGQSPYAIVVTCSDSRVIPEGIFSAGIGELFVIRVAGNVMDKHQLGSIEYAAEHLGSRLLDQGEIVVPYVYEMSSSIAAVFYNILMGLVISIFRWRKISAEFRPAKPAAGSVSGPEIE